MKSDSRLINEPFIAYLPSLARHLGSPLRAIILQMLWFKHHHQPRGVVMSYVEMAAETGIPDRTLREHIRWLKENGHLSSKRKSAMDATQVWHVHLDGGVDVADPATSTDTPDVADSATSICDVADPATSTHVIQPHQDVADSATSLSVEEELTTKEAGGAVVEVSPEQQQPSQVRDRKAVSFPFFAREALASVTPQERAEWERAWRTVNALQDTLLTGDMNLSRYLARCRERKTRPNPAEWVRWFAEDEQKAQVALRVERERQASGAAPKNPWFE